ncbi:MAG: hypothetical protein RMZ69_01890 [Nostoc sp. ChiQUE01a]|nr:hypothetical protein [Nostoc sp. DedQUE01]MDZ8235922.1 hypothetical protein [Nostoc sp. ChiQUE01a]
MKLVLNSLIQYHDPRYPTPVLSKAKTSPPLGKGRGWGWGKKIVVQIDEKGCKFGEQISDRKYANKSGLCKALETTNYPNTYYG